MIRSMTSTLVLLAGIAAATPAIAQSEPAEAPSKTLKGDPDRPLGKPERTAGSSTMSMMQSDGADTVKVKIENGEISAEVNGKAVPKDRIRQSDGKIEILDDKGNVQHTLHMQMGGFSEPMRVLKPRAPRAGGEQPGFRVERRADRGDKTLNLTRPQGEPPKVMLGITMSTADETTLDRLGAKSESGVFVDSVIEGLAAEKAGLEVNDLILEADGKAKLTEEGLRDILKAKNPGDELKLKVFRRGETKDLSVKLQAFEAEKLMKARPDVIIRGVPGEDQPDGGVFEVPGGQFWIGGFDHEKLKKHLEEALSQLKEKSKDWDQVREKVEQHLQDALKEFEEQGGDEVFRRLQRNFGDAPRIRLFSGDRGGVIAPPPAPAAPEAPGAASSTPQLDRIAEQLERLNRRLDDLEKKLNDRK